MRRSMAGAVAILTVFVLSACSSSKSSTSIEPAPTTTTSGGSSPTSRSTVRPTTTLPSLPASTSNIKVADSAPPPDVVAPGAKWVRITRDDGKTQVAAVYTPTSGGRHPVVVYLHGSSGLAAVQVRWARKLARAGFLVVVGCYLNVQAPGSPATASIWISCPDLGDIATASDADIHAAITALIDAATTLPGANLAAIGVMGVSEGGIRELTAPDERVKAIAADSSYGKAGADPVNAPVLLLGHDTDPNVPHGKVAAFEQELKAAGKTVDSHYYAGNGHVVTLDPSNEAAATNATNRVVAFFQRYLREN